MDLKNQLTKTPYLVLFIVLISIGVGTASALITITLAGDVLITGVLDMTGDKIRNVATPTLSSDAATKNYVDQAPSTDTLALLGCTKDQVAIFDGNNWNCRADCDRQARLNLAIPTFTPSPSCLLEIKNLDSSTEGTGYFPSIAIGTDGFPVISYGDNANNSLLIEHCTSIDCSTKDAPLTLDSSADVIWYTSIAIGTDGFPVISYYDNTNDTLKFVHCTTINCSATDTPIVIDNTGNVGLNTSIAIGIDGFPVISYDDSTNDTLKFVHCTTINCSATDTPIVIGSTADFTAGDSSIAIGIDGFPVISYHSNALDLTFVHCSSIDCTTAFLPRILDSTNNVGAHSSIAIGIDGFPVISYQYTTFQDLRVVHCNTLLCFDNFTIQTLDELNFVGEVTSIAIGLDGFPVISYYDNTNDTLKFVHCTSIDCSTFDRPIFLDTTNSGDLTSIAIGIDGYPVIAYRGTLESFPLGPDLKFVHCGDSRCLLK